VYVVHSYDKGQVCGQPQEDGLLQALAEAGFRPPATMRLERFYMQSKTRYTTAEAVAERGRRALARIRRLDPDLVVTLDDNAARTVMLPLAGTGVPVVFSGINLAPERYNRIKRFMDSRRSPGGNVTGVYEKLYIGKTLELMQLLLPPFSRVIVLLDDTATGEAVRLQVQDELAQEPPAVAVDVVMVRTLDEYAAALRRGGADASVGGFYTAVTRLLAGDGSVMQAARIIPWTVARTRKPLFSVNIDFVRAGILGGIGLNFRDMGYQAGRKAVAILQGTPAGRLPIEDAKGIGIALNVGRARELGITIPVELLGSATYLFP